MEGGAGRLEQILADHCAPVICGKKASNLVAIERGLYQYLPQVLGDALSWKSMCSRGNYCHVLIYDRERMEAYIRQGANLSFLQCYGYGGMDLDGMLEVLAARFEDYQKKRGGFPHEIGVFLEYPLEDIEGFINNEGRDALECGYWKVYGDVEKARRTFRVYDALKAMMTARLKEGYTIIDWRNRPAVEGR